MLYVPRSGMSHACVCVLNNVLLTCNYDFNTNSCFKKGDT
jgi:hypothetical protein